MVRVFIVSPKVFGYVSVLTRVLSYTFAPVSGLVRKTMEIYASRYDIGHRFLWKFRGAV
jgi:hypothetical protein